MNVGSVVDVLPGQCLGRTPTKITITATVIEYYEWSWTGPSALLVKCKPLGRAFMVNLKHGDVLQVKEATK